MKLHQFCSALIISILTLSSSAFAIDQVILKNGTVVEGKVLNDVPNRHVDIRLVNGDTKRFQQTEVSSIERDVPSNTDSKMSGNTSEMFLGFNLGGALANVTGAKMVFNGGARFGVNASQLGNFSKLAFALSFNASSSNSELMLQALFRKVANSGFYFGPELGLMIASSTSKFDIGGLLGYDYYASNSFSFGPEVHLTSVSGSSQFKFLLGGTFHF